MFDEIDRAYFTRRARDARERAEMVPNAALAKIHRESADHYERMALSLGSQIEPNPIARGV
jgi:hypothetical protein